MNTLKDDKLMSGLLSSVVWGKPQEFKNMAVVPLFTLFDRGPEYLTLGEAMGQGLVTVTEVSQQGSVPRLTVVNRAAKPVLLVDGEELVGANQNRVLNTTVLLAEKSEIIIPVSCTEQGRWTYASPHFGHSNHIMAATLRKMKSCQVTDSLKNSDGYAADQ